ncbi:MAG: ABC transporter permease [Armatimonadetes bacterium]|nr:ABC transporter permease [Armatimonadota bacterium]
MVSIYMALQGLGANKLRSFLTMLGIIIGVGAVIIAIAIGQGSRQAVAESLQRLGTNVMTAIPGQQRRGNVGFGFGSVNTMKLKDAEAILKGCPSIARVTPAVNRSAQVKYANKNTNTNVQGTGEDYPVINNHYIAKGRYFNVQDVRGLKRVAVLGSTTAKDLFDRQSPLNKRIQVSGTPFTVIGVLKEKGGMGFRNPDDGVYVPVTTAMRRLFGMENIQSVTCQARSAGLMRRAQSEVEKVLMKQHNITNKDEADFFIFNQADLMDAQNEQQDTFSKLITYLAIVSLMVGGIGIMNIMLVSVTERTREIGVRKAIGAKRRNILSQFLLEAMFLSLVGGLLGVAFGISGASFVGKANNWKIILSPQTIIMAFSFSAIVGIFFGFYPAFKASKLNPIDALRYE